MDDKAIVELIKAITKQEEQLKNINESMNKLEERMARFEAVQESDIKQNERIAQILTRLEQGSEHFEKLDNRVTKLEMADGRKAKDLWKQVIGVFIATGAGAIIGNIGGIIHWLGGGK